MKKADPSPLMQLVVEFRGIAQSIKDTPEQRPLKAAYMNCAGMLESRLSAPPLAEPDVEEIGEADKEIFELICAFNRDEIQTICRTDIAAIIRKHLRPTQQTEGASAAPQAEGDAK